MKRETHRVVRNNGHWVKVSRVRATRVFIFSVGHTGSVRAFDTSVAPFEVVRTWHDAIAHADQLTVR